MFKTHLSAWVICEWEISKISDWVGFLLITSEMNKWRHLKLKTDRHVFCPLVGRKIDCESGPENWFSSHFSCSSWTTAVNFFKKNRGVRCGSTLINSCMYFVSTTIPTKSVTRVNDQFVKVLTLFSWEWPIWGEWLLKCSDNSITHSNNDPAS